MKQGPKSPHRDAQDPRVSVPDYLPADRRVRRPLVLFILGVTKAVTALVVIALAGGAFAVGVALATKVMQ